MANRVICVLSASLLNYSFENRFPDVQHGVLIHKVILDSPCSPVRRGCVRRWRWVGCMRP